MIDWSSTASSETLCRNPRAKSGDVNKKQVKEENRRQRQDKIRIQQRRINCKSIFVQLPNTARRPFLGHSQREMPKGRLIRLVPNNGAHGLEEKTKAKHTVNQGDVESWERCG